MYDTYKRRKTRLRFSITRKCTTAKNDRSAAVARRCRRRGRITLTSRNSPTTVAAATMMAGVFDRVLPGRRSQYLHRVNVERGPRPPATAQQQRPHSYHGGCVGGATHDPLHHPPDRRGVLRASGLKLAAKFWSSCGSSRAAAAAATATRGRPAVAVRRRAATVTTNGGFSNISHTWRFKRLR